MKIYYENKLLTVNVDDIESIIIPAQHCGAVLVRESAQKVENVLEFDRKKKNHLRFFIRYNLYISRHHLAYKDKDHFFALRHFFY